MGKIVNDPRNLPVTISVTDVDTFERNGVPEAFIKLLVSKPINKLGKEAKTHYIIGTDVLLRFQYPRYIKAFRALRNLMDACWMRNIHYIMINKKPNV